MKKRLLLVLAIGMAANAFAQPEVSDKWVITPVTTMKGVLGRLDINFPADIERNILIYQQADNKFLRSVSRNDKTYTIAPGEYRFTLTNVPVDNVPIKKGHETRLKAGFLDIVSEGDWHLYDETKEKAYTSGNKPKKLPLPVGRYQIKLGGQFYPVIIKDGETVEDYTPVEVKNETLGNEELKIIETEKWVMTPINNAGLNPGEGEMGAIDLRWPGVVEQVLYNIAVMDSTDSDHSILVANCRNGPCPEPFMLPQKTYNIYHQQRMDLFTIRDVPIRKGYETRLKLGFLHIYLEGDWRVIDSATQKTYISGSGSDSFFNKRFFPVGVYQIANAGTWQRVVIKDKETVVLRPPSKKGKTSPSWVITPLQGPDLGSPENGRLEMNFPGDTSWTMSVQKGSGFPYNFSADDAKNKKINSFSLPPGMYRIRLNGVSMDSVPIERGMNTRIKTGLLKLDFVYAPEADPQYVNQARQPFWYTHRIESAYSSFATKQGPGSRSVTLPVGKIGLKIFGTCPLDNIVIKEREVTRLNFQLGIFIIRNPADDKNWRLEDECEGIPLFTIPEIKKGDIGNILGIPIGSYRLAFSGISIWYNITGVGSDYGKTYSSVF